VVFASLVLVNTVQTAAVDEKNIKTHLLRKSRKWNICIQEIAITNLEPEELDVFVVIKLGHSYRVLEGRTTSGMKQYLEEGDKGNIFVSELQKNLAKDQSRNINLSIKTTYHASYMDIQEKDLVVEVWRYGRWTINSFVARRAIPLIEIATGDVMRSDNLFPLKEGGAMSNKSSRQQ